MLSTKTGMKWSKEDFAGIASCGYEMSTYRKPELEADEAFTSLYYMNVKMTERELREAAEKILSDPECGHCISYERIYESGRW